MLGMINKKIVVGVFMGFPFWDNMMQTKNPDISYPTTSAKPSKFFYDFLLKAEYLKAFFLVIRFCFSCLGFHACQFRLIRLICQGETFPFPRELRRRIHMI